jgi:hypothetical protein
MVAHGLMLRARLSLAALGRNLTGGRRSLALIMIFGTVLLATALEPSPSPADGPPPYNLPPYLSLTSSSVGGGVWEVSGYVGDENPSEATVTLSGAPLAEPVTLETDANGGFSYYASILGPGAIYGRAQDDHGYYSGTATTFVGY